MNGHRPAPIRCRAGSRLGSGLLPPKLPNALKRSRIAPQPGTDHQAAQPTSAAQPAFDRPPTAKRPRRQSDPPSSCQATRPPCPPDQISLPSNRQTLPASATPTHPANPPARTAKPCQPQPPQPIPPIHQPDPPNPAQPQPPQPIPPIPPIPPASATPASQHQSTAKIAPLSHTPNLLHAPPRNKSFNTTRTNSTKTTPKNTNQIASTPLLHHPYFCLALHHPRS
jgi:hypothetical protein